jgi:uncharacterized membrane protein
MSEQPPLRKLSRRTFDWLEAESRHWVEHGTLDEPSRARILSQYDTESLPHRGTMALTLIAVLMCAIGVTLVIGYNWQRIPPALKVTMIMASVAAAFGGSALAYARKRQTLGEVLALSGTLLFGNGIWLIAQVLHIQGHFPDAFLWFSVGALIASFLVESIVIGTGAAILIGVWILSETSFYPHVIYPFLALWPCAVWVAYRLRSGRMIYLLGLAAALWIGIGTVNDANMDTWPAAVLLAGCGLYAIGRWHDENSGTADGWRVSGLCVVLVMSVPLMVSGVHREIAQEIARNTPVHTIVITSIAALVAISAIGRPARIAGDWAVLLIAVVGAAWSIIGWSQAFGRASWFVTASTVAFSAGSLIACVAFIRSAFRSNRTSDLAFGVLFGLGFLIVRWTSVIENLLWSGLLLLMTGCGLLYIARLWLRRDRTALAGRTA